MASSTAAMRVSTDVGGTFTDVVCYDERSGRTTFGKKLSSNQNIALGIEAGIEEAESTFGDARVLLHGSTIAINTLLERKGARTALVTTRGFRDVYEIGRINRPDAYNLFFRKHVPLIDRCYRFEVDERTKATGEVLKRASAAEIDELAARLKREEIASIGIVFLNSYVNPDNEVWVKAQLQQRLPDCFITASHELSREYREFERTSTAIANAYIGPRVRSYLDGLDSHARAKSFQGSMFFVQSTGGLFDLAQARSECIRMLESGPAAGVVGVQTLCKLMSLDKAIAFDMGGTTAKAGVIMNGEPLVTRQVMIGGYAEGLPAQISTIDIQEVGTGGGSIARVETGGAIRVGPQSAGSSPGPVCYALGGTEPTVTDANLVLGRLSPDKFLGGTMKLDMQAAHAAIKSKIADPLGLSTEAAAEGIIRIASASMANVVRRVTTERGLDVREFPLFAIGGAGPLHVGAIARDLQVSKIVIPPAPGHFSAFGMLAADLRRDFVQTIFTKLAAADFEKLESIFLEMERRGTRELTIEGSMLDDVDVSRSLDMRYVGQEHAVTVAIPLESFRSRDRDGIKAAFDREHLARYAFLAEAEPVEIVSVRTSVRGILPKPSFEGQDGVQEGEPSERQRKVYLTGGWQTASVVARDALCTGDTVVGPALIEEHATTTVLFGGDRAEVDKFGNLAVLVEL